MKRFRPNYSSLTLLTEKLTSKVADDVLLNTRLRCPVLTGRLKRSYRKRLTGISRLRAMYRIATDVEYAPYVEFGTRYMHAQPHLGPAVEAVGGRLR